MRPYPKECLEQVKSITRPFVLAHGEPIAWGVEGARSLGIRDLDGSSPDYGDPSEVREGEIAVYWVSTLVAVQALRVELDCLTRNSCEGLRRNPSARCSGFQPARARTWALPGAHAGL